MLLLLPNSKRPNNHARARSGGEGCDDDDDDDDVEKDEGDGERAEKNNENNASTCLRPRGPDVVDQQARRPAHWP